MKSLLPMMALLVACAPRKMLVLENQVLDQQNSELRTRLAECESVRPPAEYATDVTLDVVGRYLAASGHADVEVVRPGVLTVAIDGANHDFRVNLQLMSEQHILFITTAGYLELEQATSSQAMVLLLTQLAAINYDLLLGKLQLNPSTGDIALSVELNLDDGLGLRTFQGAFLTLIKTADDKYPDLLRAAQGVGL